MTIVFSQISQIPVRSTPSEKSEMTTQILYGESYEILDKHDGWQLIRCLWDNYTGWIASAQIAAIVSVETEENAEKKLFNKATVAFVSNQLTHRLPISFGSELRQHDKICDNIYETTPIAADESGFNDKTSALLYYAGLFSYAPYLWGGRSAFGTDCSGLVQILFKALDIRLPRDAHQQAELGQTIDFIEESVAGDLVFFDNADGKITHVGLLRDSKSVIHASGHVRIDPIDHHGIFNPQTGKYSHKLRIIKRLNL